MLLNKLSNDPHELKKLIIDQNNLLNKKEELIKKKEDLIEKKDSDLPPKKWTLFTLLNSSFA